MRVGRPPGWLLVLAAAALVLAAQLGLAEPAPVHPLLPRGLSVTEPFRPGSGPVVGEIQTSGGDVLLVHAASREAHRARPALALYEDDTVYCLGNGSAQLRLVDGSVLKVAPDSRLVLRRVVFAPKEKVRATFLGLDLGKIRFLVRKMVSFGESEFRVKTRTALAGVRGSDFVIHATESSTEITTFDDTQLEVFSLADPARPPTLLGSRQRTRVEGEQGPSPTEDVGPERLRELAEELPILARAPGGERPDGADREASADRPGFDPRDALEPFGGSGGREDVFGAQEEASEALREDLIRENRNVSDFPQPP